MRGLVVALLLLLVSLPLPAAAWELVRNDDTRNIRVYLRDVPHSSYKSFYAVTLAKTRLTTVVAVLLTLVGDLGTLAETVVLLL